MTDYALFSGAQGHKLKLNIHWKVKQDLRKKGKKESEVTRSCLTLSDPMDCGPPGSSVHGIFQARVLEWGAIAFSTP